MTSHAKDLNFLMPGRGPLKAPGKKTTRRIGNNTGVGVGYDPSEQIPRATALDQAWLAFLRDRSQTQGAADRQYGKVQTMIDSSGKAFASSLDQAKRGYQSAIGSLAGAADNSGGQERLSSRNFYGRLREDDRGIDSFFGDSAFKNDALFDMGNDPSLDEPLDQFDRDRAKLPGQNQGIIGTADKAADEMVGDATHQRDVYRQDVLDSYKIADEARSKFSSYVQSSAASIRSAAVADASSIRQRNRARLQQAGSNINPDGSLKTPEQMAAERYAIERDTDQEVGQRQIAYLSDAQKQLDQLHQASAALDFQAAEGRLKGAQIGQQSDAIVQGAREAGAKLKVGAREGARDSEMGAATTRASLATQLKDLRMKATSEAASGSANIASARAGARAAGTGSLVEFERARTQMREISGQFTNLMANLMATGSLELPRLELQQMGALVEWQEQNAETVVPLFDGILNMIALASAPNSGSVNALGIPSDLSFLQ